MVDILYNVIGRPIANEPDVKDRYRVDKALPDTKPKRVEDDEPNNQGSADQSQHEQHNKNDSPTDEELVPEQQGKGKYKDKDGREHLDIYV